MAVCPSPQRKASECICWRKALQAATRPHKATFAYDSAHAVRAASTTSRFGCNFDGLERGARLTKSRCHATAYATPQEIEMRAMLRGTLWIRISPGICRGQISVMLFQHFQLHLPIGQKRENGSVEGL